MKTTSPLAELTFTNNYHPIPEVDGKLTVQLKQRNRFEDTLANVAVGVGSALLVFLLTNGCTRQTPGPDATMTPAIAEVTPLGGEPVLAAGDKQDGRRPGNFCAQRPPTGAGLHGGQPEL